MSENQNKKGENFATAICMIIVVVFVFIGYMSCCNSETDYNVAKDPNGFLGYSDDFWDWLADQ